MCATFLCTLSTVLGLIQSALATMGRRVGNEYSRFLFAPIARLPTHPPRPLRKYRYGHRYSGIYLGHYVQFVRIILLLDIFVPVLTRRETTFFRSLTFANKSDKDLSLTNIQHNFNWTITSGDFLRSCSIIFRMADDVVRSKITCIARIWYLNIPSLRIAILICLRFSFIGREGERERDREKEREERRWQKHRTRAARSKACEVRDGVS